MQIDRESLEQIEELIDIIKDIVHISTKSIFLIKIYKFLIGNKIDAQNRKVLYEEAVEYSLSNDIKYFKASSKRGYGIKEVFEQLYQNI